MDRREECGSRRGVRRYNKQESAIRQIRVGSSKKRARKTHRTMGRERRKIERIMGSVQISRRHDPLLVCPWVPDKPPSLVGIIQDLQLHACSEGELSFS